MRILFFFVVSVYVFIIGRGLQLQFVFAAFSTKENDVVALVL